MQKLFRKTQASKSTHPCINSFWIFRSSANEPANWSSVGHWLIWMLPSVVPCRLLPSEFVSKSWDIVVYWFHGSKSTTDGIGLSRPTELAFDEALCRKSGDSWNPVLLGSIWKRKGDKSLITSFQYLAKWSGNTNWSNFLLYLLTQLNDSFGLDWFGVREKRTRREWVNEQNG